MNYADNYVNLKHLLDFGQSSYIQLTDYDVEKEHEESKAFGQDELVFDSNFESGNLWEVFSKKQYCYNLILNNDTNTKGYT